MRGNETMLGYIKVQIWRDEVFMIGIKKREDEVNDYILNFLASFNDDANYEIVGTNSDGYCTIDLYGKISRIHECINNDKPFNI